MDSSRDAHIHGNAAAHVRAPLARYGRASSSPQREGTRDGFLKGNSPTSSQSDLPSPAHCLSPEGQGHREGAHRPLEPLTRLAGRA